LIEEKTDNEDEIRTATLDGERPVKISAGGALRFDLADEFIITQ
jgi:hypothetical protein